MINYVCLCSLLLILYVINESKAGVCSRGDYLGSCIRFENCNTAMKSVMTGEDVEKCGYDAEGKVLVCCYDNPVKITRRIKNKMSHPKHRHCDSYEYDSDEGCPPLPSNWTVPERGRKAWQKCLEYQDKLVYPCKRLPTMMPGKARRDQCSHKSAGVLVVGGVPVIPNDFPHMVLLGYNFRLEPNNKDISRIQWLCGGSLISERYVLTAAHCLADGKIRNVEYVYVGGYKRTDMSDPAKVYHVARRIKYPSYEPSSKYDDIALLELDREVPLDDTTVPACLHVGDEIDDSKVIATGWGMTEYQGGLSNKLQKVTLTKFSTRECRSQFPPDAKLQHGFDVNTQLCYGDKKKSRDTCQGDSGGPIQIDSGKIKCMYMIVGLTSFGRACGFVGEPAIYTRLAYYVPWIEKIVWPEESEIRC